METTDAAYNFLITSHNKHINMKRILIGAVVLSMLGSANVQAEETTHSIETLEKQIITLKEQQECLSRDFRRLSSKNEKAETLIIGLQSANKGLTTKVDSLQEELQKLKSKQKTDKSELLGSLSQTNNELQNTMHGIALRTWWYVGGWMILLAALLAIATTFAKKIRFGLTTIQNVRKGQEALQKAQEKMQEGAVELDDKLLELLDKQMAIAQNVASNDAPDHSLALKVADEIVRIELNLSRMDASIRGYKQLAKAVERMKDNFKANGYEIVDMLGKPYNEGMKVIANFVVDEELEEGKQIITGITKPQINYNGQMIQAAQISVSQNI